MGSHIVGDNVFFFICCQKRIFVLGGGSIFSEGSWHSWRESICCLAWRAAALCTVLRYCLFCRRNFLLGWCVGMVATVPQNPPHSHHPADVSKEAVGARVICDLSAWCTWGLAWVKSIPHKDVSPSHPPTPPKILFLSSSHSLHIGLPSW